MQNAKRLGFLQLLYELSWCNQMEEPEDPYSYCKEIQGLGSGRGKVILIDVDQTLWEPPSINYEPDPGTLFYTAASRAKHELRIVCNMDADACNQTLVLMGEKANKRPEKKLANVLGASLVR